MSVEYDLIVDTDASNLIRKVDERMSMGWVAQGGISIRTISKHQNELIQAVVKADEKGDL